MYWLGAPFRFLYKLYFGFVYILSGIILYPYFLIALSGSKKYQRAVKVKKIWARTICVLTFIKVKIINQHKFPKEGPYIVVANHASYLDIIVMYRVIPHDFAFLGKAEVLKWPIINVFFKRGIDIPVYRNSRKKAAQSIKAAHDAVSEGRCIAIFPEGKMQDNPPTLERFKNGAFTIALDKNVPIVPITFINNYKLFSEHTDFFGAGRPGVAKVNIHDTIVIEAQSDLVSLRNLTFHTIKGELRIWQQN